jgi:hypothetical protein
MGLSDEPLFLLGEPVDRTGVFVDAGYLFAAGSILLCGRKLRRGEIRLTNAAFLNFIRERAATLTGLPLLRVYWYDGTDGPPTPRHIALAYESDVKLRLGLVNRQGAQKGVDSLIVTDLINLARNRAMASAVLLTGDEDIRVGVLQAQEYGVRVHLVGITAPPGGEGNQAALLRQEADHVCDMTRGELQGFMTCRPSETSPESPALGASPEEGGPHAPAELPPVPGEKVDEIVEAALGQMDSEAITQVATAGRYSIPPHLDGLLLTTASRLLGGPIPAATKKPLRARFFAACDERAKPS